MARTLGARERDPADATRVGATLAGRYELQALLGAGAMGVVYAARDRSLQRDVAVKLLPPEGVGDARALARLRTEARASARLNHPHLLEVFDVVEDASDGTVFIVQQRISGVDLRRLLDEKGRLPAREALEILVPVLDGLAVAHRAGVYHRDVKPENILVSERPGGARHATLIDFGLARIEGGDEARLTTHRTLLGTPRYMSPEQVARASSSGGGADVWAAAVVLYELLAGRAPFVGDDRGSLFAAIEGGHFPALHTLVPGLPRGLCGVVHAALDRDPARRTPSVEALLSGIVYAPGLAREAWMVALRGRLHAPPAAPRSRGPRAALLACGFAALATLGGARFVSPTPATATRRSTQRARAASTPRAPVTPPSPPPSTLPDTTRPTAMTDPSDTRRPANPSRAPFAPPRRRVAGARGAASAPPPSDPLAPIDVD